MSPSPNLFQEILDRQQPEDRKILEGALGKSQNAALRLKRELDRVNSQEPPSKRRVTLSSPTLSVAEPIRDSSGRERNVTLFTLLNAEAYRELRTLVGPLLEATLKAVKGTDIEFRSPLYEPRPEGSTEPRKPLLDEKGKQMHATSTLDEVREIYSTILGDKEVIKHLTALNKAIKERLPGLIPKNRLASRYVDDSKVATPQKVGPKSGTPGMPGL